MRVGTKAPLPKKPRVLKTCARHPLRQIVYDDHDEVDYTNRVPRLRPVSNEIRRTSLLVESFRRSGGTRFVYPHFVRKTQQGGVFVWFQMKPDGLGVHDSCSPLRREVMLLCSLSPGPALIISIAPPPDSSSSSYSSPVLTPHPNPRSMVALDLRSSFLQPVHSFPACLNSTIAI